jgi:endonuclease/exonuclease/phosphatase family metal-dependent hydrolase
MRIITYNIQSGLGIDSIRDVDRVGSLVTSLDANLAGLQEVESGSPRSRFQNQPRRLGDVTGMYWAFGHGFQRGPWRFGNLILSRFPIISSTRHALPSTGEPRSVLAARVECTLIGSARTGQTLNVLCTHLGLDRAERVEQVREIRRILDGLDGPAILMGDFNDTPGSSPLAELTGAGDLKDISSPDFTFPAPTPTVKIDYIFVRGLEDGGSSRVINSPFSDHLPVLAEAE